MYQLKLMGYILLVGAIAYSLASFTLFVVQRQLMFFPCHTIEATPTDYGLPYESVWIPVNNNQRIHGWWLPAKQADAPVVLYLHGNGGNISANLARVKRLYAIGVSLLVIDYRGYGLSEGPFPSEKRMYEDAETAWHYLVQQRNIPPQQLYVFGHSLGGAIAIELASRKPEVPKLVIEGSFTSMLDMATYNGRFRWLPVRWLLNQRFQSLEKLSAINASILLIHGMEDSVVPAEMSEQLYEAAPVDKELWLVEGGSHRDVASVVGKAYEKRIGEFFKRDRAVL